MRMEREEGWRDTCLALFLTSIPKINITLYSIFHMILASNLHRPVPSIDLVEVFYYELDLYISCSFGYRP